jgi:uncharacterized protein
MKIKQNLKLGVIPMMLITSMYGASFDCSKASSSVEKMICNNVMLSELDEQLGKQYKEVLNNASDDNKILIKKEQKSWMKDEQKICKTNSCLEAAYTSRISALKSWTEIENSPDSNPELSTGVISLILEEAQEDIDWVKTGYKEEFTQALKITGDEKSAYEYLDNNSKKLKEIRDNFDWQMDRLNRISSEEAMNYKEKVYKILK